MKTPYEIKKALKCESISGEFCEYQMSCLDCEFYVSEYISEQIAADALNYIQQLENHIGEITEMVAQLEAAQPKWISVDERLPDDCIDVLVFVRNGYTSGTSIAHALKGRWWSRGIPIEYVTHWMPLSEPPKEETHE